MTISGRVRNQQGVAAQGVRIYLHRMPGFVLVVGDFSRNDGSFQLSVAPGRYRLTVEPRAGGLMPQVVETCAIFANANLDLTLERGVMLSGQIRDTAGNPVGAFVSVETTAGLQVSFAGAGDQGRFSLGAPPGTYRVRAWGPEFVTTEIRNVVLTTDRVLNFSVERGVLVEGRVVDWRGQPMANVPLNLDDPLIGNGPENFFNARGDGTFSARALPGKYVLTADPSPPNYPARTRINLQGDRVGGIALEVSPYPSPFVPDVPPTASLIRISTPDASGEAQVSGLAGSVPAESSLAIITLDTGHFAYAQAAADGSFSARTFAPSGSSLLIKSDMYGISHNMFLRETVTKNIRGGTIADISAVPGTILRVPDPPQTGSGISFGAAAQTIQIVDINAPPAPVFSFQGFINRQQFTRGDSISVQGTLKVVGLPMGWAGQQDVNIQFALERLSGPDGSGSLARNTYASVFMTPTDLPIERMPRDVSEGIGQFQRIQITGVSSGTAEGPINISMRLPDALTDGFYRPFMHFVFPGITSESSNKQPMVFIRRASRIRNTEIYAPIIRIGDPSAPRLYWTLLTDTLSNGTRGVGAVEDRGRFGVASRILTQSETFIVPRSEPVTGRPIPYRLEPFVLAVNLDDSAAPSPPLIPFKFPSGSLTVHIRRPDSTSSSIGPAPFVQSRVNSLADRQGILLDSGGGHITDAYQLSTMDPRFEVTFNQDGLHVITLEGSIEDTWGNRWSSRGTYEVYVARTLALDTSVLPMASFEVGDVFTPGLTVSPAVPAEVKLRLRLAPNSDASRMVESNIDGSANRFGYFYPAGKGFVFEQQGEYRVDITATYRDEQGNLWMGSRTWGGVVAPRNSSIIAHGRRGIDNEEDAPNRSGSTRDLQWLFRNQTGIPVGGSHMPFPFNSGDILWAQERDAATPLTTIQDPSGNVSGRLRTRAVNPRGQTQVPLHPPGTFDERTVAGEVPLFSSRPDGIDPHFDPSQVDLWAYSYRSVQRPLVRVREVIGEDLLPPPYWRFGEQYADQIGVGENGDLTNEIKFQYAGVVLRGPALSQPLYAIYGSLFVLVADDDPKGTRTFPPFQGNGGGPTGGPIMSLRGQDIDLFLHMTGVRPGTILETGDTFSLAGAIGPTLAGRVSYTVSMPSGQQREFSGQANRIGYYYRPADDFLVTEPGLYTVTMRVMYDGVTSAGRVTSPFPTGGVLGSVDGSFHVYVVPRGSPMLGIDQRSGFLSPPASFSVIASLPGPGLHTGHVTAMMPGFLLQSGFLSPEQSRLQYAYDPAGLAREISVLDVSSRGQPDAADLVTITLFAQGTGPGGAPVFAARAISLHGLELLSLLTR